MTQDADATPKQVVVYLEFCGVDADNSDKKIIRRGRIKSMSVQERKWLRRRQAIEPAIGHLKQDSRMDRCWLQGVLWDALHTIGCAAGYNLRWLLRAIACLGIRAAIFKPAAIRRVRPCGYGRLCGVQSLIQVRRAGVFDAGGTVFQMEGRRWA